MSARAASGKGLESFPSRSSRQDQGESVASLMKDPAELGNLGRLAHPRQLIAYLGLVPSETSGEPERRDAPYQGRQHPLPAESGATTRRARQAWQAQRGLYRQYPGQKVRERPNPARRGCQCRA
jgi:hypothetical protein